VAANMGRDDRLRRIHTECVSGKLEAILREIKNAKNPVWKSSQDPRDILRQSYSPVIRSLNTSVSSDPPQYLYDRMIELRSEAELWLERLKAVNQELCLCYEQESFQKILGNLASLSKELIKYSQGKIFRLNPAARDDLSLIFYLLGLNPSCVSVNGHFDCLNSRSIFLLPPHKEEFKPWFLGLAGRFVCNFSELELPKNHENFLLLYSPRRHVLTLNSSAGSLGNFAENPQGHSSDSDRLNIQIDPFVVYTGFSRSPTRGLSALGALSAICKIYLLCQVYPDLLDLAYIDVVGVPLSARRFFQLWDRDFLFSLAIGNPTRQAEDIKSEGDSLRSNFECLERYIYVEPDHNARTRAKCLFYLLLAELRTYTQNIDRIHIVFPHPKNDVLQRFTLVV